jgi:ATP-dependent DNA helicase DinG
MPGRRLLEDAVAAVLGPGGALAAELPSYEARPGQVEMARRVAQALDNDERLLVEAGTGTGKTLAYLVPAILSGRKVVVATGTRTLQDQIARLDLPRLKAVLEDDFSFAVMKGLGNYICRRRLAERSQQLDLGLPGESDALQAVLAFAEQSATGDRAELVTLGEEAAIWRDVTAAPELRLGKRCPHYERCFVTSMRQRGLEARVVVVNHHLFFADLALRTHWPEAQVLPTYEVVIFDEAHQVEEVATELYGLHVSSQRLFALARDLVRAPAPEPVQARVSSLSRRLQAATEALATALRDRLPAPAAGQDEVRVPMPADLWATGAAADSASPVRRYHALDTVLEETEALYARLAQRRPPGPDDDAALVPGSASEAAAYAGLGRRAEALRVELGKMVDSARRDHVRWISASPRNVSLRASPIDVSPLLATAFDAHPGPLVFTSATLSTGGSAGRSFGYIRARLGLQDTAAEAEFASPFRYHRQSLLYLATDLPDPTAGTFPAAAAARMVELCTASRGRALLLFTSFKNLRLAEAVFRRQAAFPLLVQGERPRHALLEALRTRLGSVLLATQGFWEGVDVPGEALSLVAMDRLPFAVPVDPLTAARIDHIREAGGDPFAAYQLPRAALALKQGFGRLIRSRRDRGVVAILDGRIARRGYGHTLLDSLPRSCPRTEDLEDVTAFFAGEASAVDVS